MTELQTRLSLLIKRGRFNEFLHECVILPKNIAREEHVYKICSWLGASTIATGHGLACYQAFREETETNYYNLYASLETGFAYLPQGEQTRFARLMRMVELGLNPSGAYHAILACEDHLTSIEKYEIAQQVIAKWPDHIVAQNIIEFTPERIKINNERFIDFASKIIDEELLRGFVEMITRGRFIEARSLFPRLTQKEIYACLFATAKATSCFATYDFTWEVMRIFGESAYWHSLLADITLFVFKQPGGDSTKLLDGAKELSFFHTYRAAELKPEDINLQEELLSLYELENECFDITETKILAEQVLAKKPESQQSQRVLSLIKNFS
jgi:hypothetical protein